MRRTNKGLLEIAPELVEKKKLNFIFRVSEAFSMRWIFGLAQDVSINFGTPHLIALFPLFQGECTLIYLFLPFQTT